MIPLEDQNPMTDEERRAGILDALGQSLSSKRTSAMAFRAASGIEDEWTGDDEFYQGYDDANRHEFVKTASKPTSGGASSELPRVTGSTVFPNITQPYVDAAAARVGDMLMPTDDRNFLLQATPIPDLFGLEPDEDGNKPEIAQDQQAQLPNGLVVSMDEVKSEVDKIKAEAAKRASKAQDRIDDWLTECQYHAEVRKVIGAAAKLGSGVIKGPHPVVRRSRQWRKGDGGVNKLIIAEEIKPGSKWIDCWNLFPHEACGEDIHNGAHIFERDYITAKQLKELKAIPRYIASQIDLCIEEGPRRAVAGSRDGVADTTQHQFEIWYFHGEITADEMQAAGCDCGGDGGKDSFPAIITMVNDRVIHAALNPLDSGEFPYDVIPWKRRPNMPWGMGVARQMRTPQRIVVAATRNMMDNAGLGAGPQFVVRRGVEPQDGVWEIRPRKIWVEGQDSDGQAGAPFLSVVIPMLQQELMGIIQMGLKMAEDVTGLPQLLQGNQGSAPDTVGGMTIMNNNANSVLRRIARLFDSCITEPHIRRYYAWLMEYGENDDEKGDFHIFARGSSALVERDIQSQEMVNVLQLCLNPAFGKSPKKAMDEYLKSRRFDPSAFDFSETERKKMAEAPQQPPIPIAVAQIKEQGQSERHAAELQLEQQSRELDRALEQWQTQIDATIEAAKLDGHRSISAETLKAQIAQTTAKLTTQMRLAMRPQGGPQVATPAMEPPGRAPNGQAFQA